MIIGSGDTARARRPRLHTHTHIYILLLDGLLDFNWQIGIPNVWACSKFRSQQLILLSSRLVYAFIFQCHKDLSFHNVSQKNKGDIYVNTSLFLKVFFWMDCWISIGRLGFGAPEGRKVGSLKQRVRSELAR